VLPIPRLKKYISHINSGKIKSGKELRQAVKRYEDDLLREDIYFDEKKAEEAVRFISHLKHYTGQHNGKPFILELWQVFIVANIFGWYRKDTGFRRYTGAYIEIARKNGKTALSAAISLYCLLVEGEANAEIIVAANSREQAKICFEAVSNFCRKLDPRSAYVKTYRNEATFQMNKVKIVSSDDSKLDGYNPSLVILDEFHAAKNSKTYDVLKSAQGMRSQPLFIIITTAGFNKSSPCYTLRKTAKEVLEGLKTDDSQFIAIYNLDEHDDFTDPENWIKSNPNVDVTIKKSFIRDEINKAKNNVSLETGVRTKTLNQWCDTVETWIADEDVIKSFSNITFDDIDAEEDEIIVAVDLASTSDLTAVSYMYIKNGQFHFINRYYLPDASMNTANDREYYKQQHKLGNIILMPNTNVTDYDYILNDILTINKSKYISKVCYDSWNSTQFVISATNAYLKMIPFSQGVSTFNRPTKEFERLMLQNKIVIEENEITRWMMSNVYLRFDTNGNSKPDKSANRKKIDGVISMLMCLGTYLMTPRNQISIT